MKPRGSGAQETPVRVRLIAALEVIPFAVASLALTGILGLSIAFTAVFCQGTDPARPDALQESMDIHMGLPSMRFIAGVPLFIVLVAVGAWLFSRLSERGRNAIVLLYILAAQVIWISALALTDYRYADSVMLSRGASYLLNGDLSVFAPDYCAPEHAPGFNPTCVSNPQIYKGNLYNYFAWYPFQAGPLWWFVLVYAVLGTGNVLAFQIVNAFAMTGAAAVVMRFGAIMGLDRIGRTMLQLLLMLCAPLLMFSTFVYTNAVGLCIMLVAALLLMEALRANAMGSRLALFVGGFLFAALAVMVKSTFNILVLALMLVVLLGAIRMRRYWMAMLGAVFSMLAMKSAALATWAFQKVTGQDYGSGLPTASWIAMGLQSHENIMPGWWTDESLKVFQANNGNSEAVHVYAIESIRDSLSMFADNPKDALHFFVYKLVSEWAEPSFQTGYYSTLGTRNAANDGIATLLTTEPGRGILTSFNNIVQTAVYALALVAVLGLCRYRKRLAAWEPASLFLSIGFLGGFLCYVFWEAKSVYAFPFYLMLFPLAAYGLQLTMNRIVAVAKRFHRTEGMSEMVPNPREDGDGTNSAMKGREDEEEGNRDDCGSTGRLAVSGDGLRAAGIRSRLGHRRHAGHQLVH